ncbi:hypothetical protein [Streptomyces sp. NPDC058371]|uniref:hypothetical protein n=1 Tax=Streptomyces sp. NPDC058371 TaxID=3346463 RepID=UPI0036645E54
MSEQPTHQQPTGEPASLEPAEPREPVAVTLPGTSAPEPAAEPAPEAAPRKPLRRGRVAAIAGSVLLAIAVIGGAGYTVVTVGAADRDAGAPVWRLPKAAKGDGDKAESASGLSGVLVPYEADGWRRGPDIADFGSDASLSGRQATALRKESLSDLPRSQRLLLEKEIDEQHIKGMAMRSYLGTSDDAVTYFTVSIVLSQMEDGAAVRGMSSFQNEFFAALKVFRKGPKIEGHKNAECFLPRKDADEKLDAMVCSAYEGDVLVSATAYGAKPLDTKGVAQLLRKQLDRISEPGEAV